MVWKDESARVNEQLAAEADGEQVLFKRWYRVVFLGLLAGWVVGIARWLMSRRLVVNKSSSLWILDQARLKKGCGITMLQGPASPASPVPKGLTQTASQDTRRLLKLVAAPKPIGHFEINLAHDITACYPVFRYRLECVSIRVIRGSLPP